MTTKAVKGEGFDLLKTLEAADTLAQVCVNSPEFMAGWDRSGTAGTVAEALTALTGKQFTVAHNAGFTGATYNIVSEETLHAQPEGLTFILMELTAWNKARWWRAVGMPLTSICQYPAEEEVVSTIQLMFTADDGTKAREYVREKYPNAKFFGDKS